MATNRPPARGGDFVFPTDNYQPSSMSPPEMTTISSEKSSDSSPALIVIIVLVILVILGFIIFMLIRRYRRKTTEAKTKQMTEGHPEISLPTLGTHYELKSLLSLNNIGRKGSRQSEFSVAISEKTLDDKAENLSDNRVSKYIDHDHVDQDTVDFGNNKNFDNDVTLESILDSTQEHLMDTSSSDPTVSENSDGKMSETQNAPTAEPESFESRPVSLANDDLQTGPKVHLTPPSPNQCKERPKSDIILGPAPELPVKKKNRNSSK